MTTPTRPRARANAWSRLSSFQRTKLAFLFAGFVSFLFSVSLWFFVDKEQGMFVGLWVPSVLALGALVLAGERDER